MTPSMPQQDVEWLRFEGLERHYGARQVFGPLAGVLRGGTTVGLVGPNGAGKSSLVRILAGIDEPDAGSVRRARGARAGYLSQTGAEAARTLRELLQDAFARHRAEEARVRALEAEMTTVALRGDAAAEERLLHAYGVAREAYDRHGGAGEERRMRAMLSSFGFEDADLDRPAAAFSGGERSRAALARVLLEEPDYLILDEPTNHLDVETVRWLEEFLIDDPRATLVVSHDRYFLDRVANEIWEIDGGTLECYTVPQGRAYAAYIEEKAARRELAERAFERGRDEERRRKAVIAELRTHGSHNYAQVRSREKQLAKFQPPAAPRTSQQKISVRLEAARRATNGLALVAEDLAAGYGAGALLFEGLELELARGERLAIVGPNGAGKSTLLNVLAGRRRPERGRVRVMHGVRMAYFSQDAGDDLPPGKSAVEAVLEDASIGEEEARALLGRLGLGGDAGDKAVEDFSGGERRRIMLARLMARSADVLLLDEPTNDLDIPSREALEIVLTSYGGALVVVSHDRYLLRRLAERVLWLHDGSATTFEGGYEKFEASRRARAIAPKAALPALVATAPPNPATLEREARLERGRHERAIVACELEVARLDAERARLEREFADPGLYGERERVAALEHELDTVQTELDAAFLRWEELTQAVGGAE
jgi:ATP-binding cassette subfamily F protein 3